MQCPEARLSLLISVQADGFGAVMCEAGLMTPLFLREQDLGTAYQTLTRLPIGYHIVPQIPARKLFEVFQVGVVLKELGVKTQNLA